MLIIIVILFFVLITLDKNVQRKRRSEEINQPIEHFTNFTCFANKQIPEISIKNDHYLDFLQNVKDNLNYTGEGPFKTILTQKKALDIAFKLEPNENPIELATINALVDKSTPVLYNTSKDTSCVIKADNLCQHTNPYEFLVDTKNTFPPKWTKGNIYENVQLTKETSLNCWNHMYNCCKQNFI